MFMKWIPGNHFLEYKLCTGDDPTEILSLPTIGRGYVESARCQCYKTFFLSLLTMRPNNLECLCLATTFQSSLTFAGSTTSFPMKEASESSSNWVWSGLCPKFLTTDWKGFPRMNPLAY
jgi:hypothetical protein